MNCPLTDRQREVLLLVTRGLTAKQAGQRLGIGPSAVYSHLGVIYQTLGVSCMSQACAVMLRCGWVVPDDLLPDYMGHPYTTSVTRNKQHWVPTPAQRLYLDAFQVWLEERDERAHARTRGYRHVVYFEREIPPVVRGANDFDGMIARLAPVICTPEQLAVLRSPYRAAA